MWFLKVLKVLHQYDAYDDDYPTEESNKSKTF